MIITSRLIPHFSIRRFSFDAFNTILCRLLSRVALGCGDNLTVCRMKIEHVLLVCGFFKNKVSHFEFLLCVLRLIQGISGLVLRAPVHHLVQIMSVVYKFFLAGVVDSPSIEGNGGGVMAGVFWRACRADTTATFGETPNPGAPPSGGKSQ